MNKRATAEKSSGIRVFPLFVACCTSFFKTGKIIGKGEEKREKEEKKKKNRERKREEVYTPKTCNMQQITI